MLVGNQFQAELLLCSQCKQSSKRPIYLEIYGLQKLVSGHVGVLGLRRVPIAQEDVMQPVRHDCVLIHQVPDAFQYRLEVVLLRQNRQHRCRSLEVFLIQVGQQSHGYATVSEGPICGRYIWQVYILDEPDLMSYV